MPAHSVRDGDADPTWILIPARNASETLGQTLDSLVAQSWTAWRAIIIDDGSTDATRAIATAYADRDNRIAVVDGPARGVSAARNLGLSHVEGTWMMFLDADDWLDPSMLERMMGALAEAPEADAVHCGWIYTDWEGNPIGRARCEEPAPDLFAHFARYCAFHIHACVVRHSCVRQAGAFDETLTTSEDFDLWQRIARLGSKFLALDAHLVTYRLRNKLSWFDGPKFLKDALAVVARGHESDARLNASNVPERNRMGRDNSGLADARAHMVIWAAAVELAHGHDATALLNVLDPGSVPLIESNDIADVLLRGIPLARCLPITAWETLWPEVADGMFAFLAALEARTGAAGLATRVRTAIEARIVRLLAGRFDNDKRRMTFGATAAIGVEVTKPLTDIATGAADRLIVYVFHEGALLGTLALPAFEGRVHALVIKDAIAATHAWPLLEALFARQVYPQLSAIEEAEGWAIFRGAVRLGGGYPANPIDDDSLHNRVGWAVFAQELTGLPDWNLDALYSQAADSPELLVCGSASAQPLAVDVEGPIASRVEVEAKEVDVEMRIGGVPLFLTRLSVGGRQLSGGLLRATALDRGKMELAKAAVREAIVGYEGDPSLALAERLRAVRHERASGRVSRVEGALLIGSLRTNDAADDDRRAALPACLAERIPEGVAPGTPLVQTGETARTVLYLPELMTRGTTRIDAAPGQAPAREGYVYGRHHFEALFAKGADPWSYCSPYEQTKYEQTLSILPPLTGKRVLEVGCAEGHFTQQLAPLVGTLVVADISEIALARTAERCAGMTNIRYQQLDLASDDIAGGFDLIVCSELLYFMEDVDGLRRVARKLAGALASGGYLITAHANLCVDDPDAPGFDWQMPYGAKKIGETFAEVSGLVFEKELQTTLYRIQLFRKQGTLERLLHRRAAPEPREVIEAQFAMPKKDVAEHFRWEGGGDAIRVVDIPVVTYRLPILMYHAVSEQGPEALARWRVSPAQFDAQMRYLRGAGFETATLEEWRQARAAGGHLPGRRVHITFDDGYAEFEEQVLPILRRYGFTASLFVPTDKVGKSADWDSWSGQALPLIDWDGLRRLRDAGITIGSHGVTHRHLTGLSPAEIAEELWDSKARLSRELGVTIDAIAYSSGGYDEIVEHLAAACGYRHGLTTNCAASTRFERNLALSRVEVEGQQPLEAFIRNLPEW